MEIVLKNTKSTYLEIFSLLNLDNIHENFKRFSSIKEPLEVKIFVVNESISSYQLSRLKNHFDKININICSLRIYSNNRDTILSGKSLKIDSAFIDGKYDGPYKTYFENGQLKIDSAKKEDLWHGPYKRYYENGQLEIDSAKIDGK